MDSAQTLFASVLQEIAASRLLTIDHDGRTRALLSALARQGVTLKQCSSPSMMDRPMATLKSYCTTFGIKFPDFTPPNMRTQIKFVRSGDFMVLTGEFVRPVASSLDLVVTTRDGVEQVGVPAHTWDAAKTKLRDCGFEARRGPAPKKPKVKANA